MLTFLHSQRQNETKAYSDAQELLGMLSKLFLISIVTIFSMLLVQPASHAHELARLHTHHENNTYRYSPREVNIEFIAPEKAGGDITLRIGFQSIEDEPIILSAPQSWAGTPNNMSFSDISASTYAGEKLYLEKTGDKKWLVKSPREHWVNITYSISPSNLNDDSLAHFSTVLNDEYFHAIGQLFLVLPEDKKTDLIKASITWTGFEKLGWQTLQAVASRGPEVLGKSALLSSLFFAGDLHVRQSSTRYGDVRIAMQKSDWSFTQDEFTSLAKKIIQSEREYFSTESNPDAEPFLVSLINLPTNNNEIAIDGTSLHNSFVLIASDQAKLYESDAGDPTATIAFFLAHEMMHQWIGHELQTSEKPEALGYWFTEGFTDYFTLQLLYQSKIVNLSQYVDIFNQIVSEYWLNPNRNVSNQYLAKNFWSNKATNRLPYLRGFQIGLNVDQTMRKNTDARLKDMLHKMLERSDGQSHFTAISNRSLLWNIQNRIGKPITDKLRSSVYDGADATFSYSLLQPCLSIENKQMGNYDPGFDVDATANSKSVSGVKRNSGAYRAGVRNGQRLAGLKITSNPKVGAEVAIFENGGVKVFDFFPVGETIPVPQASIADASTCQAIL